MWTIAPFVTALALPVLAYAQSSPPSPTAATPWDSTVVVGLLSGRPQPTGTRSYADDWFNAAELGAVIGRHLTPHVKAELELSTSTEGRRFVERYVQPPNYPNPVPIGAEQFTRIHEVGASLTYQFFENEWVHPFVQVGAVMDLDRVRTHTWAQSFFTGDSRASGNQVIVADENETMPKTSIRGRGVVGAGAKFYVTPRVFVRTDGRFAVGASGQHLVLRAGVGVDF
jgi:hypothetical protein